MTKEIYILGASGHALVVSELIRLNGFTLKGYFDLKPSAVMPSEIPFLGPDSAEKLEACEANTFLFPAVGANELRAKLVQRIQDAGSNQLRLIHPDASVSADARIGMSTMVGPRAVINPFSQIGNGVIINSGAIIEHECVIGDFCHIAPGATVLGNVQIGEQTFVGGNAVIKQGLKIGSQVVIGAGAVVLNDVPDRSIMVGNPAKILK